MFHTNHRIVFPLFRILVLVSFICHVSKGNADTLGNLPDQSEVLLEQCMAAFPNLYRSVISSDRDIAGDDTQYLNPNSGDLSLAEESHYLEPTKLIKGDLIGESHYLEPVSAENYYGDIFSDDEKLPSKIVDLHHAPIKEKSRHRNPAHKLKKTLKKLWFKHKQSQNLDKYFEKFHPRPLPPLPLESEPIYEEIP